MRTVGQRARFGQAQGLATLRRHLPTGVVVAINAVLAIVATYAVLRTFDVLFGSKPHPATIVWSAHIAMFWRLGIGTYVAGMVGIIASLAAHRNLAVTTRVTAALVPVVGALIAIQGALFP